MQRAFHRDSQKRIKEKPNIVSKINTRVNLLLILSNNTLRIALIAYNNLVIPIEISLKT